MATRFVFSPHFPLTPFCHKPYTTMVVELTGSVIPSSCREASIFSLAPEADKHGPVYTGIACASRRRSHPQLQHNEKRQKSTASSTAGEQSNLHQIITIQREDSSLRNLFRSREASFRYDGQAGPPSPVSLALMKTSDDNTVDRLREQGFDKATRRVTNSVHEKSTHFTCNDPRNELRRWASLVNNFREKGTMRRSGSLYNSSKNDKATQCTRCGQSSSKCKGRISKFFSKIGNVFERSSLEKGLRRRGESGSVLWADPVTDGYGPFHTTLVVRMKSIIAFQEKELKKVQLKTDDIFRDCEESLLYVQVLKKKLREQQKGYEYVHSEARTLIGERKMQLQCLMPSLRSMTKAFEQDGNEEQRTLTSVAEVSTEDAQNRIHAQYVRGKALEGLREEALRVQTLWTGNVGEKGAEHRVLNDRLGLGKGLPAFFESVKLCQDSESKVTEAVRDVLEAKFFKDVRKSKLQTPVKYSTVVDRKKTVHHDDGSFRDRVEISSNGYFGINAWREVNK